MRVKITNPIDVVCPKCNAAITAKCNEPKLWGFRFIDTFHTERINKACEIDNADWREHGFPLQVIAFFQNYFVKVTQ